MSPVSDIHTIPISVPLHCDLNWTSHPLQPASNAQLSRNHSADDLIIEENETVLKAISRLDAKENYDRIYRIRRATQLSLQQKILPKAEWTKAEEDKPYLTPILEQLHKEAREKDALDTLTILKKH